MKKNKNITYYFIAVAIFILLKFSYKLSDNNDLSFLLKPTDKLVGVLTGSHSVYISNSGYYHEQLNIIINKYCSGFNFWVLSFLLFTYLGVKYFDKISHKTLTIPTALLVAYLLTIFVNTSRIFVSIILQYNTKNILQKYQNTLHESIGIIINLTFLIIAYILTEKLLINKSKNAKLS